jgi:septal ring factor EnvC (AmiA/AmiB activator)
MNKKLSILACSAAFIGMGVAMPQCPGEKAMQDQIDGLKSTQITMTQKLNAIDAHSKNEGMEEGQIKQAITQLAGAVDAQKDALKRLDDAIKDLQTKVAALSGSKGSRGKSKRRSK